MRDSILEGTFTFPGTALFEAYPESEHDIKRFYKAIWYNFLNGNETNGIYWYEQLGGNIYNDVVRRLSHHGWLISLSLKGRKWISVELNVDMLLEFVTVDELEDVKAEYKYNMYLMTFSESTVSTQVKQNKSIAYTGLVRKGFRDAGNSQFGFDMDKLSEYEDTIIKNLNKSMEKVKAMYPKMKTTASSYDEVSTGIYEWHKRNSREIFTTGDSVSDSRGRAISSALKKVANPIGNKDFRSCIVIPY